MTQEVKKAWDNYQAAVRELNMAVNAKFHVGQAVKAHWGGRWQDAVVSWVPYENGPVGTHIYVKFPHHKESKKYEMGGGFFDGVRTGDFDGAGL